MQNLLSGYTPKHVEFDVKDSDLPINLGTFNDLKEVNEFLKESKILSINQSNSAYRFLDNTEKNIMRKEYSEMLELKLPIVESELKKAERAFNEAKRNLAEAKEMVNATLNEIKAIANEVKGGIKLVNLDDLTTFKVPYKDKYYYYTYISGELILALITDIPEHEVDEIFNLMHNNEEYFDKSSENE